MLVCLAPALAQDTAGTGSLNGQVIGPDGEPVASAKVCVKESGVCAVAGPDGRFSIPEIRPGKYGLTVEAAGRPAVLTGSVEIHAGVSHQVEVRLPVLETLLQTVTVEETLQSAPAEIKNSGYLLSSQALVRTAGALQDLPRLIQTLPGVAIGADDFRNDIIVRGGSPLENLFVVDNVEIPNINAFANFASAGGALSILDAALIQDITFLAGGFPAPYGNRASSVLQVAQREGNRESFVRRITAGFAGAGGVFEGPIRRGQGSWILSARRSFLDFFTEDTGIGGVPVSYSFNGKAVYDLGPRDRIWLVSVAGRDTVRLGRREGASERLRQDELFNFDIRYRGWRSGSGWNWQRLFGDRAVGLFGLTHSRAHVRQSVRDLVRLGVPPPDARVEELIAASPVVFRDYSREGETTFKYDHTAWFGTNRKVQAGGYGKLFQLRYETAAPLGSDIAFSPFPDVNPYAFNQRRNAHQAAGYAQLTRELTSRIGWTVGLRVDRYSFLGRTRISPRAGLNVALTPKLTWRSSYGHYYQKPFFQFLVAFPENAGLIPFRAVHFVTGFVYQASPELRFTAEAYSKQYRDYPVSLQFPALSLANIGDTFNVRDILFPLTSAGRGRARGVEFYLEKRFGGRWYGQANLAFSRTLQAALDGVLRPSSYDYPVIFNLVGGYQVTRNWEVAARFAYLSGRPFTPFDLETSTRQRRAVFDLTRVNAARLPAYSRVDIRVDRILRIDERPLLVYLAVQNLFDRKNVAGYSWNRAFNRPELNEQLGFFPILGLDWRF
ncbi:MAG: TonB-dependent receptor [Bryobacterales bacterium]|nr:TonB-dependent receptor [Bryobacterales bacterium]